MNISDNDVRAIMCGLDMKTTAGQNTLYSHVLEVLREHIVAGEVVDIKKDSAKEASRVLFNEETGEIRPEIVDTLITYGVTVGKKRKADPAAPKQERQAGAGYKWHKCFLCKKECLHGDDKCECAASKHFKKDCPKFLARQAAAGTASTGVAPAAGTAALTTARPPQQPGQVPKLVAYTQTLFDILGLTDENDAVCDEGVTDKEKIQAVKGILSRKIFFWHFKDIKFLTIKTLIKIKFGSLFCFKLRKMF